jgi:hypothetical protein
MKLNLISAKLEQIIVTNTINDKNTSDILFQVEQVLKPKSSKFGFDFEKSEEDTSEIDVYWTKAKGILSLMILFINEHGPLQNENLRLVIRLITMALIFSQREFLVH